MMTSNSKNNRYCGAELEMEVNHKTWVITPKQRCDLEMLLVGGFKPLLGFLTEPDYEHVLNHNRLIQGDVWPMPITLDVSEAFAMALALHEEILLCDFDGSPLAYMTISDKWKPNKSIEALKVFGTTSMHHPGVNDLFNKTGLWYLGGMVRQIKLPPHYDFNELRHTPESLKQRFLLLGYEKIIGFQTRNPIHYAHKSLTLNAAKSIDGHLLIHPVAGLTKTGDIDYYTRVRCYQKIMSHYPQNQASLSLLPLAMRMAGPKEALWHALIRKNYGCTHFIVGRDHAGPGNNEYGQPFYDAYAAQHMVQKYQDEIGIQIMAFQEMVYVKERKKYCFTTEVKPEETPLVISGTKLRHLLLTEEHIPEWFSSKDIIDELRQSYPPKHQQGFTLFFTGLSGAGKSTLANALMSRLMSYDRRKISILDGDIVRQKLSSELGFSKAHRDINVQRIGFVAAEITKVGGIALCAAIAPYAHGREENRQYISQYGGYIEIHLSTPLKTCENRDTKGLYLKARNGKLKHFTGIDDPYETPAGAEITIDTSQLSIEESINTIIFYLEKTGYLKQTSVISTPEINSLTIEYI